MSKHRYWLVAHINWHSSISSSYVRRSTTFYYLRLINLQKCRTILFLFLVSNAILNIRSARSYCGITHMTQNIDVYHSRTCKLELILIEIDLENMENRTWNFQEIFPDTYTIFFSKTGVGWPLKQLILEFT